MAEQLLDVYATEPGAVAVEVMPCGPGEQERLLCDGRAEWLLLPAGTAPSLATMGLQGPRPSVHKVILSATSTAHPQIAG